MRRRDFHGTILGLSGALAAGLPSAMAPGDEALPAGGITREQMARDAKDAAPYPKPKGRRNGFDSLNMHEVLVVERSAAVRVKLEMGGKPQAAQLDDGTVIAAGFVEPPAHEKSRCTLQYSHD